MRFRQRGDYGWFLRALLWLERRQPGTIQSALRQARQYWDRRAWRLACFDIYEGDLREAGYSVFHRGPPIVWREDREMGERFFAEFNAIRARLR